MELKVNSGIWGTMFGVPCIVADNLLKLATGEQLKVLLFLLRNSGRNLSAEEISANTGVPAEQVQEAVLFWQQVNVISPENTGFSSPVMHMTVPAPVVSDKAVPEKQQSAPAETLSPVRKSVNKMWEKENYTPTEIKNIAESSADIKALFTMAENSLGSETTYNSSMQNMLIRVHNYLGLKTEVIITLVSYCCNIDRKNPRYIERIAVDWADRDINTLDLANQEVERLKKYNDFLYVIKRTFEMSHTPTTKQQEFIKQWQEFNFNVEIIHYAYERCLENTGKLSFEYINKILASWHEKNIKTLEEAKAHDKEYKDRRSGGSSTGKLDIEKYAIFTNDF